MCSGKDKAKVRYNSKRHAISGVLAASRKTGTPMRYYPCDNHYHLTTKTKYKNTRSIDARVVVR